MKVTLLDYQEYALELLIFTKNTRLRAEQTMYDIMKWPMQDKLTELDYMKKTIQSSFEFVTYVFNIEGVSRNFTHQLVRTRNAVYAQESQRTVDVRNSAVLNVPWQAEDAAYVMVKLYGNLIEEGVQVQDARNILPTGIETSITMGTNLRELMHMAETRLCKRTQGEYQEVFKAMKAAIVDVHPYFESMIEVYCVKTGICCFPNYKECPVQKHTVFVTDRDKREIKDSWEFNQHVANPIAKDGRTM
jgi:thymidylate synthase ThyX